MLYKILYTDDTCALISGNHLKVHESYFSFYFFMEKSILYAKIAVSQKKFL